MGVFPNYYSTSPFPLIDQETSFLIHQTSHDDFTCCRLSTMVVELPNCFTNSYAQAPPASFSMRSYFLTSAFAHQWCTSTSSFIQYTFRIKPEKRTNSTTTLVSSFPLPSSKCLMTALILGLPYTWKSKHCLDVLFIILSVFSPMLVPICCLSIHIPSLVFSCSISVRIPNEKLIVSS